MIIGFTGTRFGMTQVQRASLRDVLTFLECHVLHHGDCQGADAQVHRLAEEMGAHIIVHPPTDGKMRAFCDGDFIHPPKAYQARNHDIVDESDMLVATPREPSETIMSGTWSTVRYARRIHKRIVIVKPDGTFTDTLEHVD